MDVWMGMGLSDLRLDKEMDHDIRPYEDHLARWSVKETYRLPATPPTQIWTKESRRREVKTLSDISRVAGSFIVSDRFATALRAVDLGDGMLSPVAAFQKDRTTPIAGRYWFLAFDNNKNSFAREASHGLRRFTSAVVTTKKVLEHGDIACTRAALEGADIWFEHGLYGRVFLTDRLLSLIEGTRIPALLGGIAPLSKVRIV